MGLPIANTGKKPEIRIWIFNNPIRGITEQLEYLCLNLGGHGYRVSISNKPLLTGLNILIENLNEKTFPVVEQFATHYPKRLAVVMTEHMEFQQREITFHGLPLYTPSEYMLPVTRKNRLLHLLAARNYIRYFIRLGDLPALTGIDLLIPGVPILTLPFPDLTVTDRSALNSNPREDCDLIFTGGVTKYREQVLNELSSSFRVRVLNRQVSRRCRDAANASAKAVLNIPQDAKWSWISSMRIMAAWRCGRPVINVGTGLKGALADFCLNIESVEAGGAALRSLLDDPKRAFEMQFEKYQGFIKSVQNPSFPDMALRIWGLTELGVL